MSEQARARPAHGPWFRCGRLAVPTGVLHGAGPRRRDVPINVRAVGAQHLLVSAAEGLQAHALRGHLTATLSLPDVGLVLAHVQALPPQPRRFAGAEPPGPAAPADDLPPQPRLVLALTQPTPALLRALGQYILQHGHADGQKVSPQALRRAGLGFTRLDPCVQFAQVRTAAQMQAVLALRYQVFAEANILKPNQQTEADLRDARDDDAAIMVAQYRGQMVGTCRAFACHADSRLEFDAWGAQSASLPPRQQMVEMSRAALLPSFRGTDIPGKLFRRCVALAVQTGRRYMVLGTYPERVPYYRHFGFLPTPVRFAFPGAPADAGHVLLADLRAIWRGEQGGPLLWHTVFADLDEALPPGPFMPASWLDVARIGAMRRAQPWCQRALQWYQGRRSPLPRLVAARNPGAP